LTINKERISESILIIYKPIFVVIPIQLVSSAHSFCVSDIKNITWHTHHLLNTPNKNVEINFVTSITIITVLNIRVLPLSNNDNRHFMVIITMYT